MSLTANPASPQLANTALTFIATGSGGSGIYEFQFEASVDGGATFFVLRNYSTDSTWPWTSAVGTGTYQFRVNVRSAGSTSPVEATSLALPYVIN